MELFASDPLLRAVGIAKELWADEHADEYVARLRKEWYVARFFWDTAIVAVRNADSLRE
jgi:hypothetical protein